MNNQLNEQLKSQLDTIQKKINVASVLAMPGGVLLGLGMAGKVDISVLEELHPILANGKLVNIMLSLGIGLTLLYILRLFSLVREQNRLKKRK